MIVRDSKTGRDFKQNAFCPYRVNAITKECMMDDCAVYTPLESYFKELLDNSVWRVNTGICELAGCTIAYGQDQTLIYSILPDEQKAEIRR